MSDELGKTHDRLKNELDKLQLPHEEGEMLPILSLCTIVLCTRYILSPVHQRGDDC